MRNRSRAMAMADVLRNGAGAVLLMGSEAIVRLGWRMFERDASCFFSTLLCGYYLEHCAIGGKRDAISVCLVPASFVLDLLLCSMGNGIVTVRASS